MSKLKVAVLFGGISTEHEISIISAIQVMNALNKGKYDIIPLYITKKGEWIRGDESYFNPSTFKDLEKAVKGKKSCFISPDSTTKYLIEKPESFTFLKTFVKEEIDIVFPVFHGRLGEDGSIQGLLEVAGIPYVGCGVTASAIGMDKMITKRIAQSINIPTLLGNQITTKNSKDAMNGLKFPVYVKPVHLGSSIGVKRAANNKELREALEIGFFYDDKVLVEQGLQNMKEVNISLIGNNPYEVSPTEMPIASSEILSFKDKYLSEDGKSRGMASLKRIIPAPIKKETQNKVEMYATKFFAEIGGEGIVRMDFLLTKDEKKIYLNEINTMPGSLAFYLWKEKGINFTELLDKLIKLGLERAERKRKVNTTFESNVLQNFGGSKGSKN